MDSSYFVDRGFHEFQNNYPPNGLNSNHLNIFGQQSQQRHSEQYQHQPLSPGQPRSRGSSFNGSPTSPTSAHRSSMSQPSVTQSNHSYFSIGNTGPLPPTPSPVTATYDMSRSDSMNSGFDYGYGGNYNQMSMHGGNGIVKLNDSEK